MDKAGLVKADGWHVTFTAHTCPVSVEVFDESAIPKEYIHTKEVQTPDKSAIRRAIEAEIPISGARLVQRVTLLRK